MFGYNWAGLNPDRGGTVGKPNYDMSGADGS